MIARVNGQLGRGPSGRMRPRVSRRSVGNWSTFALIAGLTLLGSRCPAQPTTSETAPPPDENWASDYLELDTLAEIPEPTLLDLTTALDDPNQQDHVIERHFARSSLTDAEQETFLRHALRSPSLAVRQQAAVELKRVGLLGDVVGEMLMELAERDDAELRQSVVIALQFAELSPAKLSPSYWATVLDSLVSADAAVQGAARTQIESWGPGAVPRLVEELQTGDPSRRRQVATVLARVLAAKPTAPGRVPLLGAAPLPSPSAVAEQAIMPEAATVAKAAGPALADPQVGRALDPQEPQQVRVYFGTNRQLVETVADPRWRLWILPLLLVASLASVFLRLYCKSATPRSRTLTLLIVVVGLGASAWSATAWNEAWQTWHSGRIGANFGGRRDPLSVMRLGYCDVSIPPTHQVGEVEQPWIGAADERRHVMLRRTELLERQQFVDEVRQVLAHQNAGERSCFIFVHGYNVDFETAALRTAQIAYDLKFSGAPLFYSWPSRANVRSYFSDRNEIGYSAEHIRRFLQVASDQLDADRIHVIAHSMGAEGVSRAIASFGDDARKFDQIVLAAPDIDANLFREVLAPRIVERSQRATIYCSRRDLALHMSYAFNDSPRIGDASRVLDVVEGVDTIDASEIDMDLLGHSYYGDCVPLLHDVELLLDRNLAPADRGLEPSIGHEGHAYWTFQPLPLPRAN
jgi:esterase/lipase superfamily enzyme